MWQTVGAVVVSVVIAGHLSVTTGQVLSGGECKDYQGSSNFTTDFIQKMKSENRSYVFLMSSGPVLSCQQVQFLNNGSFIYSFVDRIGVNHNYSGRYEATPQSPLHIATIKLFGLPQIVYQSEDISTDLKVVMADDTQLVVVHCYEIAFGLLNSEIVGGMVEVNSYVQDSNTTESKIYDTIQSVNFTNANQIAVQSQNCAEARGDVLKLYDFLVTLGVIQDIEIVRNLVVKLIGEGSIKPRFYRALDDPSLYEEPSTPVTAPQHTYLGEQAGVFIPYELLQEQNTRLQLSQLFNPHFNHMATFPLPPDIPGDKRYSHHPKVTLGSPDQIKFMKYFLQKLEEATYSNPQTPITYFETNLPNLEPSNQNNPTLQGAVSTHGGHRTIPTVPQTYNRRNMNKPFLRIKDAIFGGKFRPNKPNFGFEEPHSRVEARGGPYNMKHFPYSYSPGKFDYNEEPLFTQY